MSKTTKVHRENALWLSEQPIEIRVQLLQNHLELCRIMTNQLFEDIVRQLTGPRYQHDEDGKRYYRHGFNPGSIKLNDQKLPVQIPRIREASSGKCVTIPEFSMLKKIEEPGEEIMNRVLHGISTRDYKSVTAHLTESLGLSSSQISREFIEQSESAVKEFCERTFEDHTFSALFIDGKSLSSEQIIIVLGVTDKGFKIPLGFIQTSTENSRAIGQLLKDLIKRKFKYDGGLLVIIDGSLGILKAVGDVFGKKAIIQRCQWHKRENILSHLNEKNRELYKLKIQNAYREPNYDKAKAMLMSIHAELKVINQSAANSLMEGLEQTLTLHKLKLAQSLSRSFATTNCIESLNSLIGKYTRNVKYWRNSNQRYRWIAAALLQIETRMKKIHNFKSLVKLNIEIKAYLKNKANH